MAKHMIPLVRDGGLYASRKWTPLVMDGGYTQGGGEEPEPAWEYKYVAGMSPLLLAAAHGKPLKSLTQYGLCSQSGTPTPSAPQDILCNNGAIKYKALGENLLDPSAANTVLEYYINKADGEEKSSPYNFMFAGYMRVEAGKTYVAYGRRKSDNDLSDYNRVAWYDSTKTWLLGADYTQNQIAVVTAPENAAYARFSCNPSGGTTEAVTQAIVDGYNWMFAEGAAEITPFIPFVGGIVADGTPEVLSVGGKNLNGGTIENKGYTSTGGESTSTTFAGTLWKIPCKEGDKFTASWGGFPDGVSGVFINTWKTDGTWNARQAISASTSLTYTIGAGVGIVNFTLYKTGGITIGENAWMQVEYGTTPTAYEPYITPQTASVADLFAVGNYADEQDLISGAITHKVGIKVLDGTEFIRPDSWVNGYTVDYSAFPNINTMATIRAQALSTHFASPLPVIDPLDGEPMTSGTAYWLDNNDYGTQGLTMANSAWNNPMDVSAWLAAQYAAGTPVIVVYPLAEETTESVTPQPMDTAEGDNVISVTAEVSPIQLSAEYATLSEAG